MMSSKTGGHANEGEQQWRRRTEDEADNLNVDKRFQSSHLLAYLTAKAEETNMSQTLGY